MGWKTLFAVLPGELNQEKSCQEVMLLMQIIRIYACWELFQLVHFISEAAVGNCTQNGW